MKLALELELRARGRDGEISTLEMSDARDLHHFGSEARQRGGAGSRQASQAADARGCEQAGFRELSNSAR